MIKKLKDCTEQELKALALKPQSHLYDTSTVKAVRKEGAYVIVDFDQSSMGSVMYIHEDVEVNTTNGVVLDEAHANDMRAKEKIERLADPDRFAVSEKKTREEVIKEVVEDKAFDEQPFPEYSGKKITREEVEAYINRNK